MAGELAGGAVEGRIHPQAQLLRLGHQSAQLKAALPEGQAARSPAGGLQRLRQGQVLRAQKDLYLRAAGQGGQGLVQQGPQAGQIGGRFRKGPDLLPHQRERLLGHLFPAQIELALVVQHVLGDAASGLGFDAGDLPVDVLIGLPEDLILRGGVGLVPAAAHVVQGALGLLGRLRQDGGGEAVQLLFHIGHMETSLEAHQSLTPMASRI